MQNYCSASGRKLQQTFFISKPWRFSIRFWRICSSFPKYSRILLSVLKLFSPHNFTILFKCEIKYNKQRHQSKCAPLCQISQKFWKYTLCFQRKCICLFTKVSVFQSNLEWLVLYIESFLFQVNAGFYSCTFPQCFQISIKLKAFRSLGH